MEIACRIQTTMGMGSGTVKFGQLSGDHGIAMVEFALVILVLLLIFFFGIEFGNALRMRQRVALVSRETSLQGYRECFDFARAGDSSCLQGILDNLELGMSSSLPGIGIIITSYRCESVTPGGYTGDTVVKGSHGGIGRMSRLGPIVLGTPLGDLCSGHPGGILISEAFYTYTPLIPFITRIYPFNFEFYDAALF